MHTTISSTGVNHLAISTRDIKSQIDYFTDVLGCPVRALYTGKPFPSVTLDLEHAARPERLSSATDTSIHRRRRQR